MEQVKQYEYIDLGLPSGLKWAKCNVGAKTETDHGYHFMWGSTTPNTAYECTWVNTPFNGGASNYDEEYFNSVKDVVCPNGVLAKEYDTAAQIMGGKWRMPTEAEIKELFDNTDNEWITNYNGSGVNGRKFISKTDESKYIFIPTAGYCSSGSVTDVGSSGTVWSSSLHTSGPVNAWYLYFYSGNCYMYYGFNRCIGQSVRGVMD